MTPIFTDSLHRIAYATDASAYRELPLGVAFPQKKDDIPELIRYAHEHHTSLIPRAGGTSIAGQVVGSGIVVDVSRHLNHILEINPAQRWARVQPGVVRDELNLALKPHGLFFSPETSTSNRCCIGGMLGNNSCGTHSLIYGSTRDHILEVKGFLSDGSEFSSSSRDGSQLLQLIYRQLEGWQNDEATRQLILDHFPDSSLRRRSCGYAIDEAIGLNNRTSPNGHSLPPIDLCKLLAGSEGTLAFIYEIKVALDPLPSEQVMALCAHCSSLEQSFLANLTALSHHPSAVELMDGKILQLSASNPAANADRFFVQGNPDALIIAEFCGPDMQQLADALEADLSQLGQAYCCTRAFGSDVARIWNLRKAGLGVLSGMKGDAKPIGVIEDTAVPPARLPDYLSDFRLLLDQLDLDCVFYGHISTGELHLRPIINIKTPEGRKKFRLVAEATAALVRKHRGSLSGEHGDGRLRGEFIPLIYGQECYQLMRELKQLWDPDGIFNQGKIIDTPPMDQSLRFDVNQSYILDSLIAPDSTHYNWLPPPPSNALNSPFSIPNSQSHALLCSIEQCNGAADCRKSSLMGGNICPAYKVSQHDELASTRARANIIREALTRGIDGRVLDSPELRQVLYSCLACKACRRECPSNIDMTRIRSEILQQIYDRHGTPLRSWMVARMPIFEHLGSFVAPLYNFAASFKPTAALIKKVVSFAPQRRIPTIQRSQFSILNSQPTDPRHRVLLFLDEFTRHQEPHLAHSLISLLNRLGYQVVVPKHVQSGRAAISKGCLRLAKKYAVRNIELLKDQVSDDTPIIGIEPSCILSFRDEYPDLVPPNLRPLALRIASNALLYDEFLMREIQRGHISPRKFLDLPLEVWLHGHCHQKALVGIQKTADLLRFLPGCRLHVIPSSCCGMAGSFGYEKEHYKTSIAIGEQILFPTVRKAMETHDRNTPTFIAAPGTSCRQQILDGTGFLAVHPIEILEKWVKN